MSNWNATKLLTTTSSQGRRVWLRMWRLLKERSHFRIAWSTGVTQFACQTKFVGNPTDRYLSGTDAVRKDWNGTSLGILPEHFAGEGGGRERDVSGSGASPVFFQVLLLHHLRPEKLATGLLRRELSLSLSLPPSPPLTLPPFHFSLFSPLYNIFLSCVYSQRLDYQSSRGFFSFDAHLSTHRLACICVRTRIDSTSIFRRISTAASPAKEDASTNTTAAPASTSTI